MKKINILFILLTSFLLPMKTINAEDSIFIWDTDTIIIPYGESLDNALETFKSSVTLKAGYIDPDFTVSDINYNYYMKSVISTTTIKTYKLYHKAMSPKYQKEEIKLVYIKIVDINQPVVTNSKPYTFVLGEKKPDYLTSLIYVDDVNNVEEIELTVNDSNVNYLRVGVYTVIFTLTDLSGNETIHQEEVNIIDLIPPTINFNDLNTFTIGYTFKVDHYVTTSDNHDTVIDLKYEIVEGSLEEEGTIVLVVTATDLSGNESSASKIIYVELVDTEPPSVVYSAPYQILIGSSKPNYTKNLIVEDNLSESKNILILVDESGIDYMKVGSYVVNFQLIDEVGNASFYQQTVKIFDNLGPQIHFKGINSHPVGFIFDILDFYEITDNYDNHVEYSYSLSSEIDKIGVVDIKLTATDSSGNISTATHQITIKDVENPTLFLSQKSIMIEVGSEPIDYLSYVKVSDNYDPLTVDDIEVEPRIDYHTIGSYEVIYTVLDSSLNKASVSMLIYVQDKISPSISANTIYGEKDEKINLMEGIIVNDNYTPVEEIVVSVFETNYITGTLGTFYVIYEVVDMSGNHQYFTRTIIIEGINSIQISYYIVGGILVVTGGILGVLYFMKKRKNKIEI
ncbi:MAG: hypothetical protein PHD47_00010 [Acholeplasmataceae bacterium]|nr:hypothetical protein [Acholeplasmataceae bacterium]